jgi:3-isopropylmalate dehydrogenase
MRAKIAIVSGDGIGPEVIKQAINVLDVICEKYGHQFEYQELLAGGCAIDALGCPLPEETVKACKNSDAVMLGAVGGPKWDHLGGNDRPEKALLGLRGALGLYANLRPSILYKALSSACPLRADIVGDGLDIMVVRELTGGIYFGKKGIINDEGNVKAFDTLMYSEMEVERIVRVAMKIALKRKKRVISVDKHNILESSRLWRRVAERVAQDYPDIELTHMYVDNAAMQLIRNPHQFDVIVTENMFGDILSDEAAMLTGSIGMLPSASLGDGGVGMYEPIHGSAPDIAGKNIANPIATILSAAMMLRHSFKLEEEAVAIENAVKSVLENGLRTGDIATEGTKIVGTTEMGKAIVEALK